jgi:hypothetical protein
MTQKPKNDKCHNFLEKGGLFQLGNLEQPRLRSGLLYKKNNGKGEMEKWKLY